MTRYLITIFLVGLFFLHCGKKSSTNPDDTVTLQELNNKGWNKFGLMLLDEAAGYFDEVLQRDWQNAQANLGKGWVLLLKDNENLSHVHNHLLKGTLAPETTNDAKCGLAVLYLIQNDFSETISYCDDILNENAQYFFQYLPSIDWHDLLVMKAEAQFYSGQFAAAGQTIQTLTNEYPINPANPQSWQVNSIQYFSFEAALSAVLELLADRYKF